MNWIDSFNCVDLTLYSCTLYVMKNALNFTQKENTIYFVLLIHINNVMYMCVHYCMYIRYLHSIEWMEYFLLFRVSELVRLLRSLPLCRSFVNQPSLRSLVNERESWTTDTEAANEVSERTNETRDWLLLLPPPLCGWEVPATQSALTERVNERMNERITLVNWTRWTNERKWIVKSHPYKTCGA